MKTQTALSLFHYWNRLRDNAAAPYRADIEPYDIRDVLSHTFILECETPFGVMHFRLAGTAISNLYCRSLRGTAVRDLFQEQHRPLIARLMRNCFQDSAVVVAELDAISQGGRGVKLELMMLPLRDEPAGHRLLGCIAPFDHQFWYGLDAIIKVDLLSIRVIDPAREPLFLGNRPQIALAPAIEPQETQLLSTTDRPSSVRTNLLVIEGGKSAKAPTTITKR